jgi:hypothetical protein
VVEAAEVIVLADLIVVVAARVQDLGREVRSNLIVVVAARVQDLGRERVRAAGESQRTIVPCRMRDVGNGPVGHLEFRKIIGLVAGLFLLAEERMKRTHARTGDVVNARGGYRTRTNMTLTDYLREARPAGRRVAGRIEVPRRPVALGS